MSQQFTKFVHTKGNIYHVYHPARQDITYIGCWISSGWIRRWVGSAWRWGRRGTIIESIFNLTIPHSWGEGTSKLATGTFTFIEDDLARSLREYITLARSIGIPDPERGPNMEGLESVGRDQQCKVKLAKVSIGTRTGNGLRVNESPSRLISLEAYIITILRVYLDGTGARITRVDGKSRNVQIL